MQAVLLCAPGRSQDFFPFLGKDALPYHAVRALHPDAIKEVRSRTLFLLGINHFCPDDVAAMPADPLVEIFFDQKFCYLLRATDGFKLK